ncbi:MAG: methyltransferase [Geminicoccaceae bacterium]|nr:methyltransferase [Geminicoccaceae bacterium]MCS7268002.1 methyltransferase [Geminicoccaceae bacterium]MCX7631581.1 methyltransferase [Geminicoccaceae bacterium]MDW8124084.1 methyltransferase [Geminicoccaceae bacterium]MDW8340253.1 methyltransferase [Geminicoccaceae bacterium]
MRLFAEDTNPSARAPTRDRLLGGRVVILQPRSGYRAAIDPVLLAAAVAAAPGESVLDAGCGTGAAALCLAARSPEVRVVGLERDPEIAALARESVALNGWEGRVRVITGDLLRPPGELRRTGFSWVMSNPPHLEPSRARPPAEGGRRAARIESVSLADWIAACLARLLPGGRIVLVHRADRLADLLAALRGRSGEITVFPLWPKAEEPARRVLVRARKGSRAPCRLLPGLVLHRADGTFTEAAEAILREAEPLAW